MTARVIRFAVVQLGGVEALFDATRQCLHALNRTQDPYKQARIGKMAIAIESGNLSVRRTWLQVMRQFLAAILTSIIPKPGN